MHKKYMWARFIFLERGGGGGVWRGGLTCKSDGDDRRKLKKKTRYRGPEFCFVVVARTMFYP